MATNLPALWDAPTTTPADRKSVVRLLIERVLVTVDDSSEWVDLAIRWAGGHETKTRMRRPVAKLAMLSAHEQLLDELRSFRRAGFTAGQIAAKLNEAGWVTPTQRNTFNERLVRAMLLRYGPVPRGPKRPPSGGGGWLKGRRINGQWAVAADRRERQRLHRLRREHPPLGPPQ